MRNTILAFIIAVSSFAAGATSSSSATFEVKTLAADYYLFRPLNEPVSFPTGKAPDMTQMKARAKKLQTLISEMEEEAKKLNLTLSSEKLFVIDGKRQAILEIGIPVSGQGLATAPKDKLRSRPAGKFVELIFSGDPVQLQTSMLKMRDFIKEKKLKLTSSKTSYEYSEYPKQQSRRMLVPVQ